ncbi:MULTISPECIES: histidine kinase [unclassified Streptomyces]|uniref:sensor histidine kinase n=1 Tax=unclassified Streptomyces TaxID=2593676 RepID=UPI0006F517E8|nr:MULTISPECIES: histidine kinase [unclassified Streptomyces]KQX53557.1 histidine kinase [Streptomyces sp. Root1304]KRA90475.1 histidine kinase [Streptomyces sp. Root66D1]
MRRCAVALLGQRARRRWLHLIVGGALFMPYWMVGTLVVGPLLDSGGMFSGSAGVQFGAYGVALPLVAVTALFPLARPMSVAAARALCGVPADRFADGPARGREARTRTAAWFTLHLGAGALVSGASLALPPFAVAVLALPFSPSLRESELGGFWGLDRAGWVWAAFPAGLLMLLALLVAVAATGALLARQAPRLLGPSPADRLAAAERRAAEAESRNRLARELHDSVGHALSAVTLQAGAARRVLDGGAGADLEFVREALTAIEETTRRTVGELDGVLGLLRRGEGAEEGVGPGLDALDALVRGAGPRVALTVTGDLGPVPETLSREAYRIVQEGLTNAARHAGGAPVTVRLDARTEELEISVENPLPDRPPATRPDGGRGLRGIAERARLLGGTAGAGPAGGVWRLTARIPR